MDKIHFIVTWSWYNINIHNDLQFVTTNRKQQQKHTVIICKLLAANNITRLISIHLQMCAGWMKCIRKKARKKATTNNRYKHSHTICNCSYLMIG